MDLLLLLLLFCCCCFFCFFVVVVVFAVVMVVLSLFFVCLLFFCLFFVLFCFFFVFFFVFFFTITHVGLHEWCLNSQLSARYKQTMTQATHMVTYNCRRPWAAAIFKSHAIHGPFTDLGLPQKAWSIA